MELRHFVRDKQTRPFEWTVLRTGHSSEQQYLGVNGFENGSLTTSMCRDKVNMKPGSSDAWLQDTSTRTKNRPLKNSGRFVACERLPGEQYWQLVDSLMQPKRAISLTITFVVFRQLWSFRDYFFRFSNSFANFFWQLSFSRRCFCLSPTFVDNCCFWATLLVTLMPHWLESNLQHPPPSLVVAPESHPILHYSNR
jgi:hypothetical protein